MKQKKQPIFRKCSTVGALIKQLERLPKTALLSEPVRRCLQHKRDGERNGTEATGWLMSSNAELKGRGEAA